MTRRLQSDRRSGRYRSLVTRRLRNDQGVFELRSAEDAVVLKAVTRVLSRQLQGELSRNCYHLAGHGGIKAAVRDLSRAVPNHACFMDDWVVLAPTRWKLRAAIRRANQLLCGLRLEKHPDKTFVGRIGRGFGFLGYRFVAASLQLAAETKQRFAERVPRLQEQSAATSRIVHYVRHWLTWVRSGELGNLRTTFLYEVACAVDNC